MAAVFGVYFKLQSFFFMPVFGLNNSITPIIAYSYGARQGKRRQAFVTLISTLAVSSPSAFALSRMVPFSDPARITAKARP